MYGGGAGVDGGGGGGGPYNKKATKKYGPGGAAAAAAAAADPREAERQAKERLMERHRSLLNLESAHPAYSCSRADDPAPLLACWKRISNHRSAAVFRKPVNPKEAPGYADRIPFPIDLSLVRKMISGGHVVSFRDLHRRVGLICHNCVKYNGR